MSNDLIKYGFTVTDDLAFDDERSGITPWLREQMKRLSGEIRDKSNKKIIGELMGLISRFPDVPQLKNYLSIAYFVKGKIEKLDELNFLITKTHPDYLFGKINLAWHIMRMRSLKRWQKCWAKRWI